MLLKTNCDRVLPRRDLAGHVDLIAEAEAFYAPEEHAAFRMPLFHIPDGSGGWMPTVAREHRTTFAKPTNGWPLWSTLGKIG